MHHDAMAHQAINATANNSPMQNKTRENLLKLMRENGISSERSLALTCDMDQSTLNRFLTGKTDNLRLEHLLALAHYFDITVSQLIGETPIIQDQKLAAVMRVMESLPEYKKDVLVATSAALSAAEAPH
jgi:transcriptional regulator with XRE-family HTH domain